MEALEGVAPFFGGRQRWWGADLEYCAYRYMRDRYPDLGIDDVCVFVIAARRYFAERRTVASRAPDERSALGTGV